MAKKKGASRKPSRQQGSGIRLAIWITVAVVALLVLITIISLIQQSQDKKPVAFDDPPSVEGQPIMGDPNAPVTVVEFGDYKCPSCKYWDINLLPKLKADYIDTGKVRYVFINVPFQGEESVLAALASEAVLAEHPEAFWDYHHALFAAQPVDNRPWVTTDKLLELADEVGIDRDKLAQSLMAQGTQEAVQADNALHNAYRIQYTPTIMVDNLMLPDPFDYEAIRAAIEERLGASE